jgi:hypothetical protein
VQHGASTLPAEAFHKFAQTETCEVHLATEFQNMLYESKHFPQDLRTKIYDWLKINAAAEKKEDETEEQFIYPREVALKYFKGERFNDFSLYNDETTTIKFYYALFKIVQELKGKPNFISSHSYINADEATYDFLVKFKLNYPMSFAFFVFFEEDEEKLFQKINHAFGAERLDVVIIRKRLRNPPFFKKIIAMAVTFQNPQAFYSNKFPSTLS